MSSNRLIPNINWTLPWQKSIDDDFEPVYEAYERFYIHSNTSKGRSGTTSRAANDFMDEVIEFYDVGEDEYNAGLGTGAFLNAEYDFNLLEEKMSEEELYQYLEGNL